MIIVPFKPGATFSMACQYRIWNGTVWVPSSIAGKTFTAQVKTERKTPVADLVCSTVDVDTGMFACACARADTVAWPIGLLLTDVRVLHADGRVAYSQTIGINTLPRITDD